MDLFDFKDHHLRQVRPLTKEEFDLFRATAGKLNSFRRWERSLGAVKRNQEEFEAGLAKLPAILEGSASLADAHDAINEEANRLLQNHLASFRFFLNLTETRLKRAYSDSSPIVAAFQHATTTAFDRTLAYRLLSKLRNYAQHCGSPIGHVLVRAELGQPRSASLQLDAAQLLEQYDSWGPVRADLRTGPPLLDVSPQLTALWPELEFIRDAVKSAERPALLAEAAIVRAMFAPVVATGGVPAVGILEPGNDGKATVDFIQLPKDVMTWLGVSYTPIIL